MGFYLKKSIRLGPLRYNLSKSGLGISTGVTGLRFGSGPRGNYVHMGRGGLYYRATVAPAISRRSAAAAHEASRSEMFLKPASDNLDEIDSEDVSQMVDSSSREILTELNRKRAKKRLWPVVAAFATLTFAILASSNLPSWGLLSIFVACVCLTYLAHMRDTLEKAVVLMYVLEPEMETAYAKLVTTLSQLAACASIWHVEASGKVKDKKYQAGASHVVRRNATFIRLSEPQFVKTNIETVAIGVGRQILHFFPDRILVYDTMAVGAVSYQDLRIEIKGTKFVESGAVPNDAEVIAHTWKYVNKTGGPDRRFKDNQELPVCNYEEIALSSSSGLNEVIQVSRCGFGDGFAKAIFSLGQIMPTESAATVKLG